jgi:hypothetical protein
MLRPPTLSVATRFKEQGHLCTSIIIQPQNVTSKTHPWFCNGIVQPSGLRALKNNIVGHVVAVGDFQDSVQASLMKHVQFL